MGAPDGFENCCAISCTCRDPVRGEPWYAEGGERTEEDGEEEEEEGAGDGSSGVLRGTSE